MNNLSDSNLSPKQMIFSVARTRNILRRVFFWMTLGLCTTAVTALFVSSQEALQALIVTNPMIFFLLLIAQIVLVFTLSRRIMTLQINTALSLFFLYSILNGLTLSFIFTAYTDASIAGTLFITAATFAGMALYGSTTKSDLSKLGHYLFMALIGIIIASLVNIFLRSEGLYWLISFAGVALFTILTAYDTQMIKRWGASLGEAASEVDIFRVSILGALKLYLDFINLFLFLLRFLGRRN